MKERYEQLIGRSAAIRAVREDLHSAARSNAKVLLTGESGVGKEVVARLIHSHSSRATSAFVTMNCAGVSDPLLESELFGHVRGSFTGAYQDRRGLLETAHRGTIFMDEVGETSLRMQALLLRFLETGEIQRVGAERNTMPVDVRVISATNHNLVARMAVRAFREDLYYRLNVVHLVIPPLRERREDIPLFLRHFFHAYSEKQGSPCPDLTIEAMSRLVEYDWPGNVRELQNLVQRLIARRLTRAITAQDLVSIPQREPHTRPAAPPAAATTMADLLFSRMVEGGESFWTVVYPSFMVRDLSRHDLRRIVEKGLQETRGNYRLLVQRFNMPRHDYGRFLNFLRKHDCRIPF
jgi:DNA-binding NtrC family response regulator